jgi:hypothetical protein
MSSYSNHGAYGNELEQLRQVIKGLSKKDRRWDDVNSIYVPSYWKWNSVRSRYE